MNIENFIQKSKRQRKISSLLEDCIVDEIFTVESYETLDEIVDQTLNVEGK